MKYEFFHLTGKLYLVEKHLVQVHIQFLIGISNKSIWNILMNICVCVIPSNRVNPYGPLTSFDYF